MQIGKSTPLADQREQAVALALDEQHGRTGSGGRSMWFLSQD